MLRWGVIGVGVAGRARARAIRQDPRSTAVWGFRGQPEAVGLQRASDMATLLRDCDAVAICSPDTTHPDLVRLALSAGRHVLVEYPLAGSAEVARELYEAACRWQRALHVEHIEILGPAMARLRELTRGRTLRTGHLRFTGPCRKSTYGVAHANLARVHRIVDSLGCPEALRLVERSPRLLRAAFRVAGGVLDLDLRHGEDLPRQMHLSLELEGPGPSRIELRDRELFEDGEPVALPEGPSLFLTDQLAATARILDGTPSYIGEDRVVGLIALSDALVRASPEGGWSAFPPPPRP